MKISHRYNFIFFCSPKTGSESVRELLDPYSDFSSTVYRKRTIENPFYSHMRPVEAEKYFSDFGWSFNNYRKFVCVRNPWARLVSLYEMIKQNANQSGSEADFKNWLLSTKPHGSGGGGADWKRWRKYGTYSIDNYVCDDEGRLLVDKVIKLENINTDLPYYLKQLGIPDGCKLRVPHSNTRSKKKHYSQYYDTESDEFIKHNYQYDIDNFDYQLEKI